VSVNPTSPRGLLLGYLKPVLPSDWKLIASEAEVQDSRGTVLRLSQRSITRHPASPNGAHLNSFILTVAVVNQDIALSEDLLDDAVDTLLFAIDGLGGTVAWTTCEKGITNLGFEALSYDITLTIATGSENH